MHISKESFPVDLNDQSVEVPDSGGAKQSKLVPVGEVQAYMFEDAKTLVEMMQRGQRLSKNGPCLGWRDSNPEYKWLNYGEVIERSKNISYGLVHTGMKRGQETFVGIYAQNSVEWVLVEYACYFQSTVIVPLYDTLGPNASTFILNHVEADFLVCDTDKKAKSLLDAKNDIPKLRHIIVIQEVSEEVRKLAAEKQVTLHRLKDIEELGKQKQDSLLLPSPPDLATICFTSGTTGDPKGVMLSHGNIVADACGFIKHFGGEFIGVQDRLISYLPMAHMFDRISQAILFITGGSVGFFRGDIKLLFEDMIALKPTMLPAVPRVLNKVFDKVQSEVKSSPFKKYLLNAAIRAKKAELDGGTIRNNSLWDLLILKNVRNAFGGNVRLLVSAGAPIRNEVLSFFRCCMGCLVVQAYGQTESTAACSCTVVGDNTADVVGPPLPCSMLKLMDVPDMGYFADKGEGEILIKGPTVSKGYFKDPVRTAEILDDDGWLHTGDIGRWTENGSLSVIDRKKNLLKLSQGEYISPEKVEAVYLACPYVEQIYVHGDSLETCLVAIAVPEKEALMSWCSQQGISGEWKEICEDEDVKGHVLKELYHLGNTADLKGFEQVKAIHLHPEGFSMQNNILTATMKLKRAECQRRFKDVIKKMYEGLR